MNNNLCAVLLAPGSYPMLETTHAVTINACAGRIWPWLVRMGHYLAGFYGDPSCWDKYSDNNLGSLCRKETVESVYCFREIPSGGPKASAWETVVGLRMGVS